MKYGMQFLQFSLSLILLAGLAAAQQPTKVKRPAKNPPQYPNIIDLDDKDKSQNPAGAPTANPQEQTGAAQSEALVRAVESLAGEMHILVQELRSLNLRQQAQLDLLRMNRVDARIDQSERELRSVRERLITYQAEEQTLYQLVTRESLLVQTANTPTLNREQTMQQLKLNHEARLRSVQAEQERLRKVEAELTSSLSIYQNLGSEAERRIQDAEELIRQLEATREPAKPEENRPQKKPQ